MIVPLFIVAVCTGGLATCAFRLCHSYWREDKRVSQFRHQARVTERLLAQAQEIHRLAPSGETRLLVVRAEATRDLIAAVLAKDLGAARDWEAQIETIEALLAIRRAEPPVPASRPREIPEGFRRAQLANAVWQ